LSPYPGGVTLMEAISRFMRGERVNEIDTTVWPGNKGCSGMSQFNLLRN